MSNYLIKSHVFESYPFDTIETPSGQVLISVRYLADCFEMELKKANQMITQNNELFSDSLVKLKKEVYMSLGTITVPSDDMRSFDCLTLAGALQWINLLSYSRYTGERKEKILSIKTGLVKLGEAYINGDIQFPITLNIHRIKENRNEIKDLNKSLDATISENIEHLRSHPAQNERAVHQNEHTAINVIVNGSHQKNIKYDLNTTGLEALKTAITSDEMGILCEVFDEKTRHKLVKKMVDKTFPNRNNIHLNETERALLSHRCDEKQQLLCEFSPSPLPVTRVMKAPKVTLESFISF